MSSVLDLAVQQLADRRVAQCQQGRFYTTSTFLSTSQCAPLYILNGA